MFKSRHHTSMTHLIIGVSIIFLTGVWIIVGRRQCKKRIEPYSTPSPKLNIYDEPLQSCKEGNMSMGSWDADGKCSETNGGVHQICIENIAHNTKGFSQNTGQSNWSDLRGADNHCVCLGAWSLYNAQKQKSVANNGNTRTKVLKCDAIPKIALSKHYVNKFRERVYSLHSLHSLYSL